MAREAQVPAILDIYEIPYTFGDPLVMALCLHKGLAKTVVAAAGIPTPKSWLVHSDADLQNQRWKFPLFAKPVAEGTGKGISPASVIHNLEQLQSMCRDLLDQYQQSVLIEEFLPGREFTVSLLGTNSRTKVLGTLEIVLRSDAEPGVYSYVNKERCEELVEYRLVRPGQDEEVRAAEEIALAAWHALNCRDAGRIDLRSDARVVLSSWKRTPWQACTHRIPTCPCWPRQSVCHTGS